MICYPLAKTRSDITITYSAGVAPADEDNSEGAQLKRKVLALHVLLLRIALRLKQNPRSSIVQQVVYRCVESCPPTTRQ